MISNDVILWKRWRSRRDADAFAEIVSRHTAMVYATCRRILGNAADAEDISQDCFLELIAAKIVVRSSIGPWLHTVAVRRSLDRIKTEERRHRREKVSVERREKGMAPEVQELLDGVDTAIAELPDRLRTPVILRFLEGQTHEEIGRVVGAGESTVRYRLGKGVERIRSALARRGVVVSAATLSALMETRLIEAAPAALRAALGKLALAGGAPAVVSAGSLLTGAIMMKLKYAGFLTVLLLLLLTISFQIGDRSEPARRDEQGPIVAETPSAVERQADAPRVSGHPVSEETPATVRVTGTARDAQTGQPVPGARIQFGDGATMVGASGTYSLRVTGGEGELVASAKGYVNRAVTLTLADTTDVQQDIELEPALEILCVDREGRPIEGADVFIVEQIHGPESEDTGQEVHGPLRTDEAGIAPSSSTPLHSKRPSSRSVYARVSDRLAGVAEQFGSERANPLRVVLVDTASVAGVVVVPDGFDPREVTVRLMSLSQESEDPRELYGISFFRDKRRPVLREFFDVHPDVDGRFEFSTLPSRSMISLAAEGPGLGQAQFMSRNPRELRRIELRLDAEGVIWGTLTSRHTGEPVPGVTVVAVPEGGVVVIEEFEAEVSGDGHFRIEGLAASSYTLNLPRSFRRDAWTMSVPGLVEVGAGETVEVHLELEQGALVRGTIMDSLGGDPVPDVLVAAVQGPRGVGVGTAKTDEEGRYEIRLPTGKSELYLMSVPERYYRPESPQQVVLEIADGETAKDGVDFVLVPVAEPRPRFEDAPFGTASGRVVGEDGRPLAEVGVGAWREWERNGDEYFRFSFNPTSRGTTDEDGHYELPVMAEKKYRIVAGGGEFSVARSEYFEVHDEEVHEVEDLVVRRGTSFVAGEVTDPKGKPLPGASVHAMSKSKGGEGGAEQRTDGEGRFRIDGLMKDEALDIWVSKVGYVYRSWSGIPPGSGSLTFVLYPKVDEDDEGGGARRWHRAQEMIGKRAPEWQVDHWFREPTVRPGRSDGAPLVLVFFWRNSDWPAIGPQLRGLETVCARAGAVPVALLGCTAHETTVRPILEGERVTLAVGIDKYVTGSVSANATMGAYGRGRTPLVFVIDGEGIIRHTQSGLEGLPEVLSE